MRDFICPILQTIHLDPVRINDYIFENSAVEQYTEETLTGDIVGSISRVVRDVMTREVLYTKDGDNSAVTECVTIALQVILHPLSTLTRIIV